MGASLKFDMTSFNRQVEQVRKMLHRNAGRYVRTTARRFIKRMSFDAPLAQAAFPMSGRLRAGFWPAATALGITNIYTNAPNKGEGSAHDATNSANPAFTIINSVPYLMRVKGGLGWVESAMQRVRMQMVKDLTKYTEWSWQRRELIEDLFGE
jgi:hypothetical protein